MSPVTKLSVANLNSNNSADNWKWAKMTMTVKNYFLWRIIEIQLEPLSVILTAARAFEEHVYFYSDVYFRNTRDIHPKTFVWSRFCWDISFNSASKYYPGPWRVARCWYYIPVWRHVTGSTNTRAVSHFIKLNGPNGFYFNHNSDNEPNIASCNNKR